MLLRSTNTTTAMPFFGSLAAHSYDVVVADRPFRAILVCEHQAFPATA
ncbi:hypothetical protein [Bradyrhizobium hipponense]|nr:hypothetical protein [Bradyrhizobium hipponense]